MDDQDREGLSRLPCCADTDCCSSAPSNNPGRGQGWRTIVFTAVIFLALFVMAYSLIWRDPGSDGRSCGLEPELPSDGCGAMIALPALKDRLAGYDFAMLVFPGSTGKLPADIASTIVLTSTHIEDLNVRTVMLFFPPDDPILAQVVDEFNILQFPTVITVGLQSHAVLEGNEITYDAILQAYYRDVGSLGSDTSIMDDNMATDTINGMD